MTLLAQQAHNASSNHLCLPGALFQRPVFWEADRFSLKGHSHRDKSPAGSDVPVGLGPTSAGLATRSSAQRLPALVLPAAEKAASALRMADRRRGGWRAGRRVRDRRNPHSTTESTNGHHVASNSVTAKAAERTFCANLQASETHLANGGTMGIWRMMALPWARLPRKRRG